MEITLETLLIRSMTTIEELSKKQGQLTEYELKLHDQLCRVHEEYFRLQQINIQIAIYQRKKELAECECETDESD